VVFSHCLDGQKLQGKNTIQVWYDKTSIPLFAYAWQWHLS